MDNMKCLKDTKTGGITRVSDLEAYQKAGNRFQYVSKSEWKAGTRTISVKQVEEIKEQVEETISEKQLKRKK
jgi:hypothetical protein